MKLSLSDTEAAFAATLLDPDLAIPACMAPCADSDPARRFAIYRNNVMSGLIGALRSRFPVTTRLVGDEFFSAAARVFIPDHLPSSPILVRWGDAFPDFLLGFAPSQSVPYLADIARLEVAWNCAYHAAEAHPVAPDVLRPLSPAELANSFVVPHPSAQLVLSRFPIASIWEAHQVAAEPKPVATWAAESVLVVRPATEVMVYPLSQSTACFIGSLFDGQSIGEAATQIADCFADFDSARSLLGLFQAGAVCGLRRFPLCEVTK